MTQKCNLFFAPSRAPSPSLSAECDETLAPAIKFSDARIGRFVLMHRTCTTFCYYYFRDSLLNMPFFIRPPFFPRTLGALARHVFAPN